MDFMTLLNYSWGHPSFFYIRYTNSSLAAKPTSQCWTDQPFLVKDHWKSSIKFIPFFYLFIFFLYFFFFSENSYFRPSGIGISSNWTHCNSSQNAASCLRQNQQVLLPSFHHFVSNFRLLNALHCRQIYRLKTGG